ncbi:MAG: hypothetical protein PHQ93_06190 [Sulfurimonas sp.]|uniref:hypothetical protein n=1 Tax=Sulfurimonas sp. TaxID=2022749 RepID=UPI00262574D1|nr:hypothetical protein [Sulfurimonas sp.]MDD5400755.1 hypothetical protein [Sulfurimonas sp.]
MISVFKGCCCSDCPEPFAFPFSQYYRQNLIHVLYGSRFHSDSDYGVAVYGFNNKVLFSKIYPFGCDIENIMLSLASEYLPSQIDLYNSFFPPITKTFFYEDDNCVVYNFREVETTPVELDDVLNFSYDVIYFLHNRVRDGRIVDVK